MDPLADRRPIASRQSLWAQRIAQRLVRSSVTPNQISVASVVFAAIGCAVLLWYPTSVGLVAAAVCAQLRLLCNLFDGMVAVEGGKQSALGALYNEFPDRIADTLLIVGLGYAAGAPIVGWFGALASVLTAYIRQTGAGLGFGHNFEGPFAKQQRMFVFTFTCIAAAVEMGVWGSVHCLLIGSGVIALGAAATCITRTYTLARRLEGV